MLDVSVDFECFVTFLIVCYDRREIKRKVYENFVLKKCYFKWRLLIENVTRDKLIC